MLECEYIVRSVMQLRIRHYGRKTFDGSVGPGMMPLSLSIGDTVYKKLSRPTNGQPWIQLFRIRVAKGKTAVHLGKKFGDTWHWLASKKAKQILSGEMPVS